jgi:hypothetical protein
MEADKAAASKLAKEFSAYWIDILKMASVRTP